MKSILHNLNNVNIYPNIMSYLQQDDRRKESEHVYVVEVEMGLGTAAGGLKSQLP